MIFQSKELLLLHEFNEFIPILNGQALLFWSKTQRSFLFFLMEVVSFLWRLSTNFCTSLFFGLIYSLKNQRFLVMLQAITNCYAKP